MLNISILFYFKKKPKSKYYLNDFGY